MKTQQNLKPPMFTTDDQNRKQKCLEAIYEEAVFLKLTITSLEYYSENVEVHSWFSWDWSVANFQKKNGKKTAYY